MTRTNSAVLVLAAFAVLVLVPSPAPAQSTISGVVKILLTLGGTFFRDARNVCVREVDANHDPNICGDKNGSK